MQRFEFENYYEARMTIVAYFEFYNNCRLHSGIEFKTPVLHWNDIEEKEFANFKWSSQAESGNAEEQPARNNLTNEDELGGEIKPASSSSANK